MGPPPLLLTPYGGRGGGSPLHPPAQRGGTTSLPRGFTPGREANGLYGAAGGLSGDVCDGSTPASNAALLFAVSGFCVYIRYRASSDVPKRGIGCTYRFTGIVVSDSQ